MKARHDSSFGDLLPWQTADANAYTPNFIQTHAATIAKMTSSPESTSLSKSAQPRHRISTASTPRKTGDSLKYRWREKRKRNDEKSTKALENSSR